MKTFYLQDADDAEHKDPNIVFEGDIDCYFLDQQCHPCTQHHAECHAMIKANVPNKEFCGCAVNCIIHDEHRGTMSELKDKVLKTLNQDQQNLVTAINNYVQIQKLWWLEGHNHLTNEKQLELRDKVVKYLSMVIVGRTQEWDHMSRNQKAANISRIYNEEKQLHEIQFCVLRERSCHRFKTILEGADSVVPQDQWSQAKFDHFVKWKSERFREKGSCCTLLADVLE